MRLLKAILVLGLLVVVAMPQVGDNTNVGATAHHEKTTFNGIDVYDHRGIIAGTDVDGDGLQEVWVSIYTGGGGVAGLEMVNDTTLELIYADTSGSGYSMGTRWVQVGDLDSDGIMEVIYFAGRYTSDSTAGLYIVESTGNNTFADPVFFGYNSLGFTFNGMANLNSVRSEHFLVDDVDGDGVDEIIFASNGSSYLTDYIDTVGSYIDTTVTITITDTVIVGTDTTYNYDTTYTYTDLPITDTYGHSEDFFGVLSATSTNDLQSGFFAIGPEFATSARDIDMGSVDTSSAMFGRDNHLGSGSAINVVIADTDGDGLKELILHSWNNFNTTIVEVTGPDTYSFGDSTYVQYTTSDHVCLKN
ncbi:MAG: VCBS repeat-containing protein, partial [Candidatus Marinimicrobia bacterium]|nr:VCBS repeat-containing protein [Candidatus Neomarinimicrobiota bacterium]